VTRRSEVDHLRDLMDQRFRAQEQAIDKAERSVERRLEGMNEFRQTLTDQAATFMPRGEAEQRAGANAEKIDGLAARLDRLEGRSGGASATWGYIFAAVAAIVAVMSVVALLLRP
jgi:hypothetical protein